MRPFPKVSLIQKKHLLLLFFLPFLLSMGTHNKSISPAPMSLKDLYEFCGLPIACDQPISWEGRTVSIQGTVDPVNIFDKKRFPQLPYEKFTLTDGRRRTIEVWPRADDNQPIFDMLARRPHDTVVVTGNLTAVKLPIANKCSIGIKVTIHDPSQIQF